MLLVVVVVLVAATEAVVRVLDGYRLFSPRLQPTQATAVVTDQPVDPRAREVISRMPVAATVRRAWFEQSPPVLSHPPLSPELKAVFDQIQTRNVSSDMFKLWNSRFIQERVCSGDSLFAAFPGFAFSFDPPEPSVHPPYRFLPSSVTPYGLVTNRFGFRGHEIDPDKPPGVIRIAVFGASTAVGSHSTPYSYPELLEHWLNLWAAAEAPGVRFEVLNAGREGITSMDLATINRQEVAPLEPDLVVYHEGGNQFTLRDLIDGPGAESPPRALLPLAPLPGIDYVALVRRIGVVRRRLKAGNGAEPPKPPYQLRWPPSVDEARPDPDSPDLPLSLPQVVHDLDDIRATTSAGGATLVMTSFLWMVYDGLVVDPISQATFLRMLNVQFWPATYADFRRMADFQNRVFRDYADTRHLPFIDVSSQYPRDPALFTDAVHPTIDGDRIRAWIMFQGLVPMLRQSIAAKQLPRRDRLPFHPTPAPASFPRSTLECREYDSYGRIEGAISVDQLRARDPRVSVSGVRVKTVITLPAMNAYAAAAEVASSARRDAPGVMHVRMRVTSGRMSVGVLTPDQSKFVVSRIAEPSPAESDFYLPLPSLSRAGHLMISNASERDGVRSEAQISLVELLARP